MLTLDLEPFDSRRRALLVRTVADGVRESFVFEARLDPARPLGVRTYLPIASHARALWAEGGASAVVTLGSGRIVTIRYGWALFHRIQIGPSYRAPRQVFRCVVEAPEDVEVVREQVLLTQGMNRARWLRYDPSTMGGAAGARASA